jgi:hypothetical protein
LSRVSYNGSVPGLPVGLGIAAATCLFGVVVTVVSARRAARLLDCLERLGVTACEAVAEAADGSTVVVQGRTGCEPAGAEFAWRHHKKVQYRQTYEALWDESTVFDFGGGPVPAADTTGSTVLTETLARRPLTWPGEGLFTMLFARGTWPGGGQLVGTEGDAERCEVVYADVPIVVVGVVARQSDGSVQLRDDWGRLGVYLGDRADLILRLDARRLRCRRVAGRLALAAALLSAGSGIAAFVAAL